MNAWSKLNTAAAQCPRHRFWRAGRFAFAFLAVALVATTAQAQTQVRIKSICRLKGQEQNTLQGMGLVVGLKGTGDGGASLPTIRSLAKAMELMGHDLGSAGLVELKDAKNVALVLVAATVPAAGARQGDELECTVSSVGGAKSLLGGTLLTTALLGPQPPAQPAPLRGRTTALPEESPIVYATAQGRIHLDDPQLPVTGRIHRGCRLAQRLAASTASQFSGPMFELFNLNRQ